jgi:hypothetical protein
LTVELTGEKVRRKRISSLCRTGTNIGAIGGTSLREI